KLASVRSHARSQGHHFPLPGREGLGEGFSDFRPRSRFSKSSMTQSNSLSTSSLQYRNTVRPSDSKYVCRAASDSWSTWLAPSISTTIATIDNKSPQHMDQLDAACGILGSGKVCPSDDSKTVSLAKSCRGEVSERDRWQRES